MDKTQQRIKIAVACGWKRLTYKEAQAFDHTIVAFHGWDDPETSSVWLSPDLEVFSYDPFGLPDYLNDLNAMHAAEAYYIPDKYDRYEYFLKRRLGDEWGYATAEQRAEAFLRTLGLWEGPQA